MKKLKKIGIWGQYGDGGKIADGQAVRTTIITKELQNRYGGDEVIIVNTNNWKKRPLKFLWKSFKLVADSSIVAIAPADNGFKVFVPLLLLFNIFYSRKLIYIVIGGFLPALLIRHPSYLNLVNRFNAIFVQTNNLLRDLEQIGVSNLYILSNPKRLNIKNPSDIHVNHELSVRACMLSRIYADKGVEIALEAVRLSNERLGGEFIKLDLYGMVPSFYNERLNELLDDNKTILHYNGIIDYDKTVETLQDYFVMLFPTYYHGEGFPGCVVDAYNTGLPIIATNWLYNSDVVLDGKTGLLVPIKDSVSLCEAILRLYNDRNLHYTLSLNSLNEAKKYSPDKVLNKFYEIIEQ